MAQDINKFLGNDEIFNKINSHFIKMNADEIKERNDYLKKVLEELVSAMRKQSLLFHRTYQKISWCGSFFKGTRFGAPKEYDVHFVIDLRLKKKDIEFSSDQVKPGFIKIRMINYDTKLRIQNALNLDTAASREFNSFFDEQLYLNQDNFRNWIEGILSKVARATSGNDIIKLCGYAPIKIRKSGPAFTLKHKGKDIDIDLVPVLDFSSLEFLPPKCSKMNLLQCDECWSIRPLRKHRRRFHNSRHRPRYRQKARPRFWSVVPKPLSNSKGDFRDVRYRYWRLCFYEFEKDMLSKYQDYGRMKPVIRQLKKLRDTQGWVSVKSYFLETLCFHEKEMFYISKRVSHTFLFFKMLEKLKDVFYNGWLPYYWDDDLNLLENIGNAEMMNMKCRLENYILKSIRKEIKENSYAIAKWVLTKDELEFLKNGNYVETSETESESESNQWNCVIV